MVLSIDFGFYFSRVAAYYSLPPKQLLEIPLETFWMMSRNIERIQSERDLRDFQVARVAQAGVEDAKAFMEGLQLRIGRPVITDRVYNPERVKADPDAKAQLMAVFGKG
ncbi:hypothetical protein MKR02_21810 [Klebsiella sp. K4-41]|nr:hypothetical protein [Klebsiella pneumoniae]MCS4374546.1 hypothetical protein [Klebsiella quasipneumoniae subsp. similipneumoniae]MCX2317359.1 hypothetical protein [Klebsiella quasipneumoniae]MDK1925311.1 hypothetical protein [Klebsiella sp. K4-41]MCS4418720.1 hypothetical protein [Klebsiella quasipneumoniae subsp. similipneumoniae]MDN4857984.1 hypothetical protein [Klebsiella pneumoniae]